MNSIHYTGRPYELERKLADGSSLIFRYGKGAVYARSGTSLFDIHRKWSLRRLNLRRNCKPTNDAILYLLCLDRLEIHIISFSNLAL